MPYGGGGGGDAFKSGFNNSMVVLLTGVFTRATASCLGVESFLPPSVMCIAMVSFQWAGSLQTFLVSLLFKHTPC